MNQSRIEIDDCSVQTRESHQPFYPLAVLEKTRETPQNCGASRICPFEEWFLRLRDTMGKAIIAARIEKIRLGHEGNEKPLGKGVYESKNHFGPGYRIYLEKKESIG